MLTVRGGIEQDARKAFLFNNVTDGRGRTYEFPQAPWFSPGDGDWLPQWDAAARRAVEGRHLDNGEISDPL